MSTKTLNPKAGQAGSSFWLITQFPKEFALLRDGFSGRCTGLRNYSISSRAARPSRRLRNTPHRQVAFVFCLMVRIESLTPFAFDDHAFQSCHHDCRSGCLLYRTAGLPLFRNWEMAATGKDGLGLE